MKKGLKHSLDGGLKISREGKGYWTITFSLRIRKEGMIPRLKTLLGGRKKPKSLAS